MKIKVIKINNLFLNYLFLPLILIIFAFNCNILLSQESREAGLTSGFTKENASLYITSPNSIKFEVPRESHISLSLYDESGNMVKLLYYDNIQPGIYEYNLSSQLPPGKYTCNLKSGDISENKVLILE